MLHETGPWYHTTVVHLAFVERYGVAELARFASDQLQVVGSQEDDRLRVVGRRVVVIGDRITAVIRHVLVSDGAEELEERQLDFVRLVRELKREQRHRIMGNHVAVQ